MNMQRPKYGSGRIHEIGYDEDSETLVVRFRRGGTYYYDGVDADIFEKLQGNASPGAYFDSAIKGKFKHRKVSV